MQDSTIIEAVGGSFFLNQALKELFSKPEWYFLATVLIVSHLSI